MRIFYDGWIYQRQRVGGINRYFSNIIDRLPPYSTPVLTAPERGTANFALNPRLSLYCPPRSVLGSPKLARLVKQNFLSIFETFARIDVAHPTYHFLYRGGMIKRNRTPLVITIHDMIHERYGERMDREGKNRLAKRRAVAAADAIICVSEHTKSDLIEWLRVPEERISVIPLATELTGTVPGPCVEAGISPFVMFVGNRLFYKNFARLLLAFTKVSSAWRELRLMVVGGALSNNEQEWLEGLGIANRVFVKSYLNDRELASLYAASEALIYPSLYEGFGIPPLEAMSCGTVVIAANISSIPEVVGDAAILVNPYSVDELAEAILSLRNLGSQRAELIRRGRERARKFSWDATAARTVELYRKVGL